MSAPISEVSLPYGIRDCKLTEYADTSGRVLGDTSIDLPNMQTFSFSETEEFQELRGDDRVVTTRGQGAQVEWELEAGGISLRAWATLSGGQIIEEGVSPNRRVIMRKFSSASRPFFRIEGQAISDSGGDIHGIVYRCRANDTIEGEFADGEFFVTSASGIGMPLLDAGFDLLYDWVQNETPVAIPETGINPNPSGTPQNVTATAETTAGQATVTWDEIVDADSYSIQRKLEADVQWTAGTPATSTETTSLQTGMTGGSWVFRVAAVRAGILGEWSEESAPVTIAAA